MSKSPISIDDLKSHLSEQLGFLERSAEAFDNGFEDEAKRLSVTMRVLLHNTATSHSVLAQLDRLDQEFVDSALPKLEGSVGSYSGLISVLLGKDGTRFVPHLDEAPHGETERLPFKDWWTKPVFIDGQGRPTSRKDLVLTATNQDGGAHVDPSLNSVYSELSRKNSLGFFSGNPDGEFLPIQGAERAAIRQIAHEVLKTLKPEYGKIIERDGFAIAGVGIHLTEAPPPSEAPPRKMGRNEPCFCGSGRKYKRCHGAAR
jgi:hypothetical protein